MEISRLVPLVPLFSDISALLSLVLKCVHLEKFITSTTLYQLGFYMASNGEMIMKE
jgi:hypothetical protein